MRTVLFTYEFGAGLGHLNRLIAVAKRLQGSHRLAFALPDMRLGEPVLRRAFGDDATIVPGVNWPAPNDPSARTVPTHTFADVIGLFGFSDAERLAAGSARWDAILEPLSPDLIVSDFAPTLRCATQGRIPAVVVGNGYTVLPAGRPLGPLRPWEESVPASSRANEGRLLAAANDVRHRRGGAAIDHFADLFQGERTFVCTLGEFDPYRGARGEPPLWPFNVPEIPRGGDFKERRGPSVFCYLSADHPALSKVLKVLSECGEPAEVYVQGADPHAVARRCGRTVRIHTKPADFGKVLPETAVLLHHAGLGTAYAGLAAGTPQIVLPLNLEHLITTRGLQAFGVAHALVGRDQTEEALANALRQVLGSAERQGKALAASQELQRRRDRDSVARVVEAVQALA